MAEAKQREHWSQTASLMALIANCVRDPRRPPLTPAEFLPKGMGDAGTSAGERPPDFTTLKPYFTPRD